MKNGTVSAKRLCRSGVIAALYTALTVAFGNFSFFGGLQVRPSEGLCLLPLLYSDAIVALAAGCFLSNLFSPFAIFDVTAGVAATLLAAFATRLCGKVFKKTPLKIVFGGLFPVAINAFVVPLIILLSGGETGIVAYFVLAGQIACSEAIWVYSIGTPLVLFCEKQREKRLPLFAE